ncbi:ABC transporter ATP-binding protein [Kurthia massiliensis]|uniref:ABC transporter ATP-binding protein n=1 Tax=Kurthia massiliensis TaxID=1033739 RepID=UPI00028A2E2E|nr:ABC transporter ATP-binding protein [Kurthia massiliensis]
MSRTGLERGPRIGNMNFEKPKNQRSTVKRLWQYMQKQRIGIMIASITVFVATMLKIAGPWLIGYIIDHYIMKLDIEGTVKMSLVLGATYIALFIVTYIQTVVMIHVAQKTIKRLRRKLFKKIQVLPLRFFDGRQQGDLMSRVTNDVDTLNMALTQSVTQILTAVLTIVGTTVAIFWLDWRLALVVLTVIPLIVFLSKQIIKRSSVNYRARQKALGGVNGYIEESLSASEVVTLFGKEYEHIAAFKEKNEQLRHAAVRAETVSGFMGPINNAMNNVGLGLVIGVGAILAVKGYTTVGVIAAFVTYTRQFFQPINQLSNLLNTFQSAIAGAERVFEVIDEDEEQLEDPSKKRVEKLHGDVTFDHVHFEYEANRPILKDISFTAKSGDMIAFVGPTGSGKTTIINLLSRFYDPKAGTITIDGTNIQDYELSNLRDHIGVVLQDTYLFSGTIRDNIRFGRLDATDEEVERAAEIAYAHQFIRHLPAQYDTQITSGGTNLSQGQRQLLAIARAILEDPDILILDEATSNVDTRTEVHIQKGLQNLMNGRTSFVIAHRLKTIEQADQIFVLQQGEVKEHGTHHELMQTNSFYYTMQTKLAR